jgi:hypothetical protein
MLIVDVSFASRWVHLKRIIFLREAGYKGEKTSFPYASIEKWLNIG